MKKRYQNAFFAFGLVVLIVMVTQLDFRQVWEGVNHAGYWFLADDARTLKCESCGTMEHIDCDCIEELSNHISKEHNFSLTDHIIINGKCNNCKKEGN